VSRYLVAVIRRYRFAHCKWLPSQNCGLAVFGTNSEANSLSLEERALLLDELVAAGVDPSRMMSGTGCLLDHGNSQAHRTSGRARLRGRADVAVSTEAAVSAHAVLPSTAGKLHVESLQR
jgi:hypothetical protein